MNVSKLISQILKKRGITQDKLEEFLSPPHPKEIKLQEVNVDPKQINKATSLIKQHAKAGTPIVVFGDYDADGITATAILWETLHQSGITAMPFIPHRKEHGYGLSQAGLDEAITKHKPKLIIAVDNGITAFQATRYAQQKGIKIIIVDHHRATDREHPADALIHSTLTAGSGLAWLFSHHLTKNLNLTTDPTTSLELAAIGTVADLVPLVGANRSLAKHGLNQLRNTNRIGLISLIETAGIRKGELEAYHLGFHIGPRLNAMGRLKHAVDSLRLLCTNDANRAVDLAKLLDETNRKRQEMTDEAVETAFMMAKKQSKQPAIILWHEQFHEGIIGLVAGKLAQILWKPTIVLSQKEELSKASARSIPNFNIIEAIREAEDLLESAGGHPMAAGFSIKTQHLKSFATKFTNIAKKRITPEMLVRDLSIDITLPFSQLTDELAEEIARLAPFGVGNPKPLIASERVSITDSRAVGQEGKHLKLFLQQGNKRLPAIAFNKGHLVDKFQPGTPVNVAYHLDLNTWNDRTQLQLKIKDIQPM